MREMRTCKIRGMLYERMVLFVDWTSSEKGAHVLAGVLAVFEA